jgi:hypothetical protein
MVWMIQGVKSIIGAQMDLIFAYIVEQTSAKIRINAIIWIEVVLVPRNVSKLDRLASCVDCHLFRLTISEIRNDLMYVSGTPLNSSNISKGSNDAKYCTE